MPSLLPAGELQFCDANGAPYAGGTIATYTPGTSTPAATWSDSAGTAVNGNPIVLDAAGRAVIYGSGAYRTILKDAAGNLIWDRQTSSLVSSALAPVMIAPTLAAAQLLLGIVDETAALAAINAAIAAETATRAAADTAEWTRATTAEAAIDAALAAETARAEAAEAVNYARSAPPFSTFTNPVARAFGEACVNGTGRTMWWSLTAHGSGPFTFQLVVQGSVIQQSVPAGTVATLQAIVPPGGSYSAGAIGATGTIVTWIEAY